MLTDSHPPKPEAVTLGLGQARQIDSATLLGPKGEVLIVHQQQVYRLRITSQGKLILTK
ncbi:hemin uptake protein HemP [Pelomonas sp. Root1217]|uniref:hemin uptake protein HemP n=1 Tax=Pelomonas sp. Root1217 TaxID=1736430 RepID=UPI0009EA7AE5|nr:hemin uptake protein HemP [Pelomonas sp. Root1217]